MNSRRRNNQAGYTLMEVLVALVIGAILMASIDAVFVQQTKAMAFQEDLVDLEENLRAAMGIIHRDLRTAGLGLYDPSKTFEIGTVDTNASSPNPPGQLLPSNNPAPSDHDNRLFNPDTLLIKYSHIEEQGLTVVTHPSATSVNMRVCAPSGFSAGDIIPVTNNGSPPEMRTFEISSVSSVACSSPECASCDLLTFPPGQSEWNTAGGLGVNYSGGNVLMTTHIYYVGTDSDGNPAMFRVNNYQSPHSIIAFGVVDMQVEYGLPGIDPITGEKVINYTSAPAPIQDIEMVKVTLTGETRNSHTLSSGPEGKSQRSITTEIQVRNLFY